MCGEGYISQNSNTEFIGIGSNTIIDQVKITWLSGTIDVIENVTPNQSLTITEGQSLKVNEYQDLKLDIFPNPVKNKLQIKVTNSINSEVKNIELYSLLGNKILSKAFTDSNIEVDLTNISSGIYLLKCLVGEQLITKKVVVE